MPITVCTSHSSKSLIEIYEEAASYPTNAVMWQAKSKAMIALIHVINKAFTKTQIWGLTSVKRLVLLSEDKWDSRWHVIIDNMGTNEYFFEYLIPAEKSPWKNGAVKGQASSIEEATNYLAIAMRESEGWKGNVELEDFIRKSA